MTVDNSLSYTQAMPQKTMKSGAAASPSPAAQQDNIAPDQKSNSTSESSGILIKEIRIRHFRCLRAVDVELDPLTILIGQNNSGKTSFLSALGAAIGAGHRVISN